MRAAVVLGAVALAGCYLSHEPAGEEPWAADERVYDCPPGVAGAPETCGDGIDQDCDGRDPPCPAAACAVNGIRTVSETLSFPDPGGCPWDEGDNEGPRDGTFRARSEQVATLPLPEDAVVCGLRIAAAAEDVVFDDELIVTFARIVLIQSFDPRDVFDSRDGLATYRWRDLLGERLPVDSIPYCLGEASTCALPRSEAHGRLDLSLAGAIGHGLGEAGIREGGAEIAVVTTGDNNVDSDCRHAPFDLVVSVDYVAPWR